MSSDAAIAGAIGATAALALGEVFRRFDLADRFWLWLFDRPASPADVDAYVAAILRDLEDQEQP